MFLRFDPYQIFKCSRTPAGLYVRQKWLDEESTPSWQADFEHTVRQLWREQLSNGSWEHSEIETVRRLFGLHLTVRYETEGITKALEWLIDTGYQAFKGYRKTLRFRQELLHGLPFTRGSSGFLITGATLFLATIFGYGEDERVLEAYDRLSDEILKKEGHWCGRSCSNNILRAFVVHPVYSQSKATAMAVQYLARAQSPTGSWPSGVPFYQTVNALAHLDSDCAETQVESAFKRLYETQLSDGTWGRQHKEWNTFLAAHALKKKGMI
ncbi:MAG: hypothetical protein JSU72_16130 [Deltaproteobacteria bacterium]|nr:MAG: hypothetical protein JSU72_16130 [Deltaproteobacteria bacterium]